MNKEELKKITDHIDEHLLHKEAVSSTVLYGINKRLKVIENQNKELIDLLKLWRSAKGFARVARWLFYLFIGLAALLTAIKSFPIKLK